MENDGDYELDRLSRDHRELDAHYHRYLLSIADHRVQPAEELLDEFAARLTAHLAAEDGHWIPVFDHFYGKSKGFGGELLLFEHRLLEKLLAALRHLLHTVAARREPPTAQDVLTLIEESLRFRGVFGHHHAREDNIVIPALQELRDQGRLDELDDLPDGAPPSPTECPPGGNAGATGDAP